MIARADPHGTRSARRCDDDDPDMRAWCFRPAILAADRDLRGAYDRAVARGADRDALVDYRRAWVRLQRQAADDPEDAARQMHMMARDVSLLDR